MVKHIVLWTFADGVDKDTTFAALKKGFDAFVADVPGMRSFSLVRGYAGWDVCLESTHTSREALEEGYQKHPAHLEMKKQVAATRKDRASCDYDMED